LPEAIEEKGLKFVISNPSLETCCFTDNTHCFHVHFRKMVDISARMWRTKPYGKRDIFGREDLLMSAKKIVGEGVVQKYGGIWLIRCLTLAIITIFCVFDKNCSKDPVYLNSFILHNKVR
jgi:hypothetical protein